MIQGVSIRSWMLKFQFERRVFDLSTKKEAACKSVKSASSITQEEGARVRAFCHSEVGTAAHVVVPPVLDGPDGLTCQARRFMGSHALLRVTHEENPHFAFCLKRIWVIGLYMMGKLHLSVLDGVYTTRNLAQQVTVSSGESSCMRLLAFGIAQKSRRDLSRSLVYTHVFRSNAILKSRQPKASQITQVNCVGLSCLPPENLGIGIVHDRRSRRGWHPNFRTIEANWNVFRLQLLISRSLGILNFESQIKILAAIRWHMCSRFHSKLVQCGKANVLQLDIHRRLRSPDSTIVHSPG